MPWKYLQNMYSVLDLLAQLDLTPVVMKKKKKKKKNNKLGRDDVVN